MAQKFFSLFRKNKLIFLFLSSALMILFFLLSFFIFGIYAFFIIFVFILGSAIFYSHVKNISVPVVKQVLDREYFRAKFRKFEIKNGPRRFFLADIRLLILQTYLKLLANLILLFKNSDDSFLTLKEDLFAEFSKVINGTEKKKQSLFARAFLYFFRGLILLFKGKKNNFDLVKDDLFARISELLDKIEEYKSDEKLERVKNTLEKIREGRDVEESALYELEQELFKYNKYKRKKAAFISLSTISTFILALASVGLISTLLFPQAFNIRAANFDFIQTNWSGGASTTAIALGPENITGWTYYYSKDGVSTTTNGQLSLDFAGLDKKIDTNNSDWQTHSTTSTYYSAGSVGIRKPNGITCAAGAECNSGFCADGVCCNTACTGSTCQRCDSYSSNGTGTCGFSASDQDPDNDCAASGCTGTGNCSGTGYSCAVPAADTDPNNFCAAYTCSNYIYGWSGTSCRVYSSATAHNGNCNGSGACYAASDSCTGSGAQSGSANCGSSGCNKSCLAGSAATSYDTVAEVCYTSGQNSCSSGYYCNSAGTCVSPCAGQPMDSKPSGCNSTCQYCDGSGNCRTMKWSLSGTGGGYSFVSGSNKYCKPSTNGSQGVTNEYYSGSMPCDLGPATAWGGACCGQYIWVCGYQ